MICFNGMNGTTSDSNQESISSPISGSPLSSSPVKSQTIKDLLESPIINRSQKSDNSYSDDEIIVAESPEPQVIDEDMRGDNGDEDTNDVFEVPMTQELDTSIDRINGKNVLKRQSSVCVPNITSSPRALAILKNAIKTSNNINKNCDKNNDKNNFDYEINGETNCFSFKNNIINSTIIATNSPPNHKMFGKSLFSRGSALLRAAKERNSREYGTPPKTGNNSMKDISNDLNNDSMSRDIHLSSILKKHELQSSPTFGEPKPKKKKVLFAEPVVSSEREFDCSPLLSSPSIPSIKSIENQFKTIDNELNESTDRKRNNFVHQNSTFEDNECDYNESDSQLMTRYELRETIDPVCYEDSNLDDNYDDNNQIKSVHKSNAELVPDSYELNDSGIPLITEELLDISSEDRYPCSQPMPKNNEISKNSGENSDTSEYSSIDPNEDEDPVVNVPMRLSLIKELYNIFGNIIEQYSDT